MRVQATEASPSYSMGKNKKHKKFKAKEASDSSDEATTTCNHVNMSVNFAQMKKGLSKQTFGECASCNNELTSRKPDRSSDGMVASAVSTEEGSNVEPAITIWVCLQCGHQGCDRNSYEKHALKHYETPRSSCHCIVINTSTWAIWCYKCDDDVPIEKNKKITECIDFLRKQSGLPNLEPAKRSSSFSASGGSCVAEQVKETTNRPLTPRGPTQGLCHKLKGLSNLGNTCFFNAVMQNMTQTQSLESIIQDRSKKGKVVHIDGKQISDSDESSGEEDDNEDVHELPPIEIVLPEAGALTQSMVIFLHEMNNTSNRSSTVNPSALFGQVCKKAQRFRGFQQQDSHELLRYLMDSMKMEEIKRGQSAILKHFKLPENVNPKKVPEDTKMKVKEYGKLVKHTFVDSLFGGHLLSTVMCEECKHISQIFEPFLDLSLPVTEEKPQRPNPSQTARKKETAEKTEDNVNGSADDGKTYKPTKQSKQEQKRLKRQAKKEAKNKKKKGSRNRVTPGGGEEEEAEGEGDQEAGDDDEDNEDDKKSEDQKSGEQDSSNKEDDNSDADVEDNLESDLSRCNTFGVLSMTNNSFSDLQNKSMSESMETTDKADDSLLTSSTSTLQADSLSSNITDVPNTGSNATLNELPECISGQSNDVGKSESLDGDGIVKPKLITSAVLDDIGTDLLNGNSNVDPPGDETFNRLNRSEYAKFENSGSQKSKVQELTNGCVKTDGELVNGDVITAGMVNGALADVVDNLTIEENGAVNLNEVTKKLENLTVSNDHSVPIHHNGVNDDGQDSRKHDIDCSKNSDDESLQRIQKGTKVSPPLSRQGSAKQGNAKRNLKKEAQVKSTTMLGPHYIPSSRECSVMSCLHQFTSAELLTGNNKFGCANCTKIRDKHFLSKEKREMVYSNASKYYLIYTPPAILTLHMKRFEQVGFSSRKVNRHVDFPFVLDLAPFCSSMGQGVKPGQNKILYSLYGVVEHSGRLNAGHYTAYVKVRPNVGMISNFVNQSHPSFSDYIQRYSEHVEKGPKAEECIENDVQEEKLVPPGRWYHISDSRVSEATESAVQRAQAYLLFYERIY